MKRKKKRIKILCLWEDRVDASLSEQCVDDERWHHTSHSNAHQPTTNDFWVVIRQLGLLLQTRKWDNQKKRRKGKGVELKKGKRKKEKERKKKETLKT